MSKLTINDFKQVGDLYYSDLIASSNTMLAIGITVSKLTTVELEASINKEDWSPIAGSSIEFNGYEDIRVFDIHPESYIRIKSTSLPTKIVIV